MKKRLSLLIALVMLMTSVLTACGPNAISMLEKSQEVSKWEASEGDFKFDYTVKVADPELGDVEIKIPGSMKMYTLGQDKGVIDYNIDLKDIKKQAENDESAELPADIPDNLEFKMYVNENTIIFSKDMFNFAPEVDPFEDIKGEYVGVDLSDLVAADENINTRYMEVGEKVIDLLDSVYKDYKSTMDFEKDGEKYTFTFDIANGKEELVKFVEFTQKNIDKLEAGFGPVIKEIAGEEDLPADVSKEFKDTIMNLTKEEIEGGYDEIAKTLEGSKIKIVYDFGKDQVKTDVSFLINMNGFMSLDMNISGTTKKAAVKEINFPTDVEKITFSEYMERYFGIIGGGTSMLEEGRLYVTVFINDEVLLSDTPTFIEDGRTMAPYRAVSEALGAEVEWDEETQTVTVTKDDKKITLVIGEKLADVDGEKVELDKAAELIDARTYVPVRFLAETFGFDVEFEEDQGLFFVYIKSMDKAVEKEETEEKVEEIVEKEIERNEEKYEEVEIPEVEENINS